MSIYNIWKNCRALLVFVALLTMLILPVMVSARGGCFVGDTNVLTPNGQTPISQLKSGDSVISFNTDTKEKQLSRIENVVVYSTDSYYLINGVTKVTATHPFYVNRNGQFHIVEVKDLKVGDLLTSDNKEIIPVTSIEIRNTQAFVYNLEDVSPNNTYFANDLLVHNKGGGGCFLPDTAIQTPGGLRSIGSLKSGDKVMSWDDQNKQQKPSIIGRIDVFEVDDYYIINNKIEVTGTHPFFVDVLGESVIKEVSELRVGDKLTNGEKDIVVESINHVNKPATVYNLVNVEPFNNYFADGVLVHNKGGGGGGGGHGGHGGGGSYKPSPFSYEGKSYITSSSCILITDPAGNKQCKDHFFWEGIIGNLFGIIFVPIWIFLFLHGAKSSKLKGKTFTTNQDLIDYTKKIIPKFTNTYSGYYSKDTESWSPMKPPPQVSPALYQNLATVDVLRAKVQALYERYESDWTNKQFKAMKDYVKEPYFSRQKQIFDSSFGSNFDITYKPEILSATPLKVDLKPDGEIVRLQINGQMIDFEVGVSGEVLSGEPLIRGFTEYWDVFVDIDKNIYILNIDN